MLTFYKGIDFADGLINGHGPTIWGAIGKLESVRLNLARQETERLILICRDLTGV